MIALTFLGLLATYVAAGPVFVPYGLEDSPITINVLGVGPGGETTFVLSATGTADSSIPTITFIEGPSNLVVPTQTFEIAADGGGSEAAVIYQSCGLGSDGVANCFASEQIAFNGMTSASAITTALTLSPLSINAAAAPTGGSSPAGGSSQTSQATPTTPTSPSTASSTGLNSASSTDSNTASNTSSPSNTAGAPNTTNTGAALRYAPQVGFAALLGSVALLL